MRHWRFREVLMVMTMVLTGLLCLPGMSQAQGCSGYRHDLEDHSVTTGPIGSRTAALLVTTWEDDAGGSGGYEDAWNCSNASVEADGWINGVPLTNCGGQGTKTSNTCIFVDSTAAWTRPTFYGCGEFGGYGRNYYLDGVGQFSPTTRSIAVGWLCGVVNTEQECIDVFGDWDDYTQECYQYYTPILINTRTQRYALTSPEQGVDFDIDGDGDLDRVAWTEQGDKDAAWLVWDRNENGIIDNGTEMFGGQTVPGQVDGFQALAVLIGGGPHVDVDNPLFAKLQLWTDVNHNGVSEAGELRPVAPEISAIGTGRQEWKRRDGHGNLFRYRGWFQLRSKPGKDIPQTPEDNNARSRAAYDILLKTIVR